MALSDWVNVGALVATLLALGLSLHFWRRQFRPIVSAMVKTHSGGNMGISYDLVVLNSGSIPARDVWLEVADHKALHASFGSGADDDNKKDWLSCFDRKDMIPVLHNGSQVSCSFGHTKPADRGFWKAGAEFPIRIHYRGWFGKSYLGEPHTLRIVDTDSFTGFMWG
ncbi:hypothetical protein CK218_25685 [Mesorhizobium sp. WSM3879]|uniref:hypothetical protein n=1 Tax=Mesorhizobium sp. WSM3879 TaxID=2029406 RepID=UPI000BAF259D|nr:hypothetical protein [Mesorhizobium sp. WSM3879]PBB78185.1 hypothetical protein CK218_25685 [Mesorhizobium sp. WSM3879]